MTSASCILHLAEALIFSQEKNLTKAVSWRTGPRDYLYGVTLRPRTPPQWGFNLCVWTKWHLWHSSLERHSKASESFSRCSFQEDSHKSLRTYARSAYPSQGIHIVSFPVQSVGNFSRKICAQLLRKRDHRDHINFGEPKRWQLARVSFACFSLVFEHRFVCVCLSVCLSVYLGGNIDWNGRFVASKIARVHGFLVPHIAMKLPTVKLH